MTLRNWYEGQAISGLCANSELFRTLAEIRKDLIEASQATADQCDEIDTKIIVSIAKRIAGSMIGGAE